MSRTPVLGRRARTFPYLRDRTRFSDRIVSYLKRQPVTAANCMFRESGKRLTAGARVFCISGRSSLVALCLPCSYT